MEKFIFKNPIDFKVFNVGAETTNFEYCKLGNTDVGSIIIFTTLNNSYRAVPNTPNHSLMYKW